jgi:hypothetical protein
MAGRKSRQRGGGDGAYGFTGVDSMSAAKTPLDTRGASYTQCGWDARVAPDVTGFKTVQFGGRRRRQYSRKQRGGGCGCMAQPPMQRGGGGGTGGFSFGLDNSLGKVYSSLPVGACPPAPRESQIGGAAVDDIGLVSYKSGYGFGPESVVSTASAHYLNQLPYDRTVLTGGRRSRRHRKGSRKHRKGSRKHRKGSRKHRKGSRSAHRKH